MADSLGAARTPRRGQTKWKDGWGGFLERGEDAAKGTNKMERWMRRTLWARRRRREGDKQNGKMDVRRMESAGKRQDKKTEQKERTKRKSKKKGQKDRTKRKDKKTEQKERTKRKNKKTEQKERTKRKDKWG